MTTLPLDDTAVAELLTAARDRLTWLERQTHESQTTGWLAGDLHPAYAETVRREEAANAARRARIAALRPAVRYLEHYLSHSLAGFSLIGVGARSLCACGWHSALLVDRPEAAEAHRRHRDASVTALAADPLYAGLVTTTEEASHGR